MIDTEEKDLPKMEDPSVKSNETEMAKKHMNSSCKKTDGKGWRCKKEAKPGQSFCDHHYSLLQSYNHSISSRHRKKSSASVIVSMPATTAAASASGRPSRSLSRRSSSSSSNPYEFYYYSGLGRSWRRRRADRKDGKTDEVMDAEPGEAAAEKDGNAIAAGTANANGSGRRRNYGSPSSSSSPSQIDYLDDEDEEDDNSRKKRRRKPVKARSLKSLM